MYISLRECPLYLSRVTGTCSSQARSGERSQTLTLSDLKLELGVILFRDRDRRLSSVYFRIMGSQSLINKNWKH